MKKERVLKCMVVLACLVALICVGVWNDSNVIHIEEPNVPLDEGAGVLIKEMDTDIKVIPDRYSTGAKGDLTEVGLGATVEGVQFVPGNNGTVNALDFAYRNKKYTGVVTLKDHDFSAYPVAGYNEGKVERNIKVVFENCKFSKFTTAKSECCVSYEFNNCSFVSFVGSNAVFNDCSFSGSYTDGIVPFRNVALNDCYIYDKASDDPEGVGKHSDGTQLYGYKNLDLTDVRYDNCRFEVPAIDRGENSASVNACIMLQMEYSSADGVSFTNCTINGGGYSIYARSTKSAYTLSNVLFENIRVGSSKLFGVLYPVVSAGVEMKNITGTDSLYVGSVWKENGQTHVSVSNDTSVERCLVVYTDKGTYSYTIPACPSVDEELIFDNYPFDMDIVVPEEAGYVVCFDATVASDVQQIRFVNWGSGNVYLPKEYLAQVSSYSLKAADEIIASGECGSATTYTLSGNGVLTISGTGATDSYHSSKPVPWADYTSYIKDVYVEEGVTALGNQIFRKCTGIETVTLPKGFLSIGHRAFDGCSFLEMVSMPNTLADISSYAFNNVIIQSVVFRGEESLWDAVSIGEYNDALYTDVVFVDEAVEDADVLEESVEVIKASEKEYADEEVIERGVCGKACSYIFLTSGEVIIYGEGSTYDYHSLKNPPWYAERELIKKVIVEEGVTRLGNQAFRNCGNLEEAVIEEGVTAIGGNTFIRCTGLQKVSLPVSLKSVGKYAFCRTALNTVEYAGIPAQWAGITIGKYNDELINCYN